VGAGLACSLALAPGAFALPAQGETLPEFSTRDLKDKPHESRELVGTPTLLVIITDKDAGDAMRAWFDAAETQVPKAVHRASIITLKLPFFVSTGAARGKARGQVPPEFWSTTWMDKNGDMAKALGLASSRTPYVIALDAQGHVKASVHANADAPEARSIWTSLSGR
jgi:hypothetical protein